MTVCEVEVGVFTDVPRTALPPDARDDCVLVEHGDTWELDGEATEARRECIRQKASALFNR